MFRDRSRSHTFHRERQERIRLINHVLAHYGLSVTDWEARAYLLRTHTGQTALPDNLSTLWSAAEGLLKRPCDPLDDALLARLRAARQS